MSPLIVYKGGLLKVNGALATSQNCCCGESLCDCCGTDALKAVFSFVKVSGSVWDFGSTTVNLTRAQYGDVCEYSGTVCIDTGATSVDLAFALYNLGAGSPEWCDGWVIGFGTFHFCHEQDDCSGAYYPAIGGTVGEVEWEVDAYITCDGGTPVVAEHTQLINFDDGGAGSSGNLTIQILKV